MSESRSVGRVWTAPAHTPLCAISVEVVPVDLLTQWRRCGMISDGLADYLSYAFERRDVARSILSTVVNELVENVAKYSADKLAPARLSLEHHGVSLVVSSRSVSNAAHVGALSEELAELATGNPAEVFARLVAQRRGLGLALVASDYGASLGATISPAGGGLSTVSLTAVLPASEVEQR
jgi:hypothetical protein